MPTIHPPHIDLARQLSVVNQPLRALKPHPSNARTHSNRQIKQIAESMRNFGFTNPVLVDRHGTIIAGHGRVRAAKKLGMQTVPTICLQEMTPDQVRAYIIANNKLAEKAGWDDDILRVELQHLLIVNADFDVTSIGFEVPEVDLLLQVPSEQNDPDDAFEMSGPPVSAPGDLWQLGKHRVLCGNALQQDSFDLLMASKRAAMVFTDPPYNVAIAGNVSGKGLVKHMNFAMGTGEMNEAEFSRFLTTSLTLLAAHSVNGAVQFVAMDWRQMRQILQAGQQAYSKLLNLCVWKKDRGGQGSFYHSQHELIFVFKNGKGQNRNNIQLGKFGRYRTNVWEYPCANTFSKNGDEGNLLRLHPTVKPVALVADAILDCSKRGDIVLDSFLGSGTTLIAAERTGRICYGLELDPKYVDVAIRRWQTHTGDHALHAITGKTFNELECTAEVAHG